MVNIFGDRDGEAGGSGGERGPIGPAGRIGPSGPNGDAGKEDVRSSHGVRGDQVVAGSKGDRGSPGPKGSPGTLTDLCTWMPHTVLKNLQENEEDGCFFIADLSKGIKREREGSDIKQWKSRSQKHLNLEAERASKSLTDLAIGHRALVFKNSRHINEDILLLTNQSGSHGFICVTFYISGGHEEQIILSNFQKSSGNWHEISATNTEINVWVKENGKTKRVTILLRRRKYKVYCK